MLKQSQDDKDTQGLRIKRYLFQFQYILHRLIAKFHSSVSIAETWQRICRFLINGILILIKSLCTNLDNFR